MSMNEIESKIRELRQLQTLIEEAEQEAEAIKDAIKAHMGGSEELRAGEYKVTWNAGKYPGSTNSTHAGPCAHFSTICSASTREHATSTR